MSPRRALLLLLAAAFVVRFALALALPNEIWPDEIFQTQEQGHRIAFGYGVVPWEFRVGARSYLLPGVLAAAFRLGEGLAPAPWGHVGAAAALLSALAVAPVVLAYTLVSRRHGPRLALLAAFATAVSFHLVYFAPKALSEVVGAHLLLLALVAFPREGARAALGLGLLAGSAVAVRLHLAPAAGTLLLATLAPRVFGGPPRDRRQLACALGGFALPLVGAGLLDHLTWGAPFASYVRTWTVNVQQGKAAQFGVAGPLAYLEAALGVWGLALLPFVALVALGARAFPLPALLGGIHLVVHSALGHKEWRFVYPAFALFELCAAAGLAELVALLGRRYGDVVARRAPAVAGLLALGVSLALGAGFHTSATTLSIPLVAPSWHFENDRGGLLSFARLSREPDLCGVGIVGLHWANTGGYTYLHRPVPLLPVDGPAAFAALAGSFRHAVVAEGITLGEPFSLQSCESRVCTWRRPGPCGAPPYTLQDVLNRRGE